MLEKSYDYSWWSEWARTRESIVQSPEDKASSREDTLELRVVFFDLLRSGNAF